MLPGLMLRLISQTNTMWWELVATLGIDYNCHWLDDQEHALNIMTKFFQFDFAIANAFISIFKMLLL